MFYHLCTVNNTTHITSDPLFQGLTYNYLCFLLSVSLTLTLHPCAPAVVHSLFHSIDMTHDPSVIILDYSYYSYIHKDAVTERLKFCITYNS